MEGQAADTNDISDAAFPDPALKLLLVQLNSSSRQAHCYEKARGLTPMDEMEKNVNRRTIRETRAALMQLNRQLDRMLSHN